MAWAILVGAGLLEIVWAIALKQTDGFTRFWPGAIGVTAAVASTCRWRSLVGTLSLG